MLLSSEATMGHQKAPGKQALPPRATASFFSTCLLGAFCRTDTGTSELGYCPLLPEIPREDGPREV